jgi:hypothetical protein
MGENLYERGDQIVVAKKNGTVLFGTLRLPVTEQYNPDDDYYPSSYIHLNHFTPIRKGEVDSTRLVRSAVKEGVLYEGTIFFPHYKYEGVFAVHDGNVYCYSVQDTHPRIYPGGWESLSDVDIAEWKRVA